MIELAIFVKTYRPDAHLVGRLLSSTRRFNVDGIPILLAVPNDDVAFFSTISDYDLVRVVPESAFGAPVLTEKVNNFAPGYIQQQMIKLSAHRLGAAEHYLTLDSDSFFIRDFSHADFLDVSGRCFSVLTEDKDQFADPSYAPFAGLRGQMVNAIADYFSIPPHPRATCHNNTILSADVLASLEQWRSEKGLSLLNLMEIAPLEYSWYNFYLQRYHPERVIPIEPLLRMFHTRTEFRSLRAQGMTVATLSRSYIGICINSGWAGRDQNRLVRKLARSSARARARISRDQFRYNLHNRFEWHREQRANAHQNEPPTA